VYDVPADACEFSYRESRFKQSSEVVLSVRLQLREYASAEEKTESRKKMLSFLSYRNTTQPKGFASTGCIFKNPSFAEHEHTLRAYAGSEYAEYVERFAEAGRISAGWLVEISGMKGSACGAAFVSEVHGNFVVNGSTADAQSVRALIAQIQDAVREKTGILLEEEIQYIPEIHG
jgi:UDP-N-acetylmuramate dehydrogenase